MPDLTMPDHRPAGAEERARPKSVVLVVGTGTEIGKTWVSVALIEHLRAAGRTVAARKPAQSFSPGDEVAGITDAQLLGQASGEDPTVVCPPRRWYPVPLAPPMAAAVLGRPGFTIDDLLVEVDWPEPVVDFGLIETAGGVRSPIASPAATTRDNPTGVPPAGGHPADDAVALADRLAPDAVVLVADAGLGTINAVRLSVDALSSHRTNLTVHLNRYDDTIDLHRRNRVWLDRQFGGVCVVRVDELAARLNRPDG